MVLSSVRRFIRQAQVEFLRTLEFCIKLNKIALGTWNYSTYRQFREKYASGSPKRIWCLSSVRLVFTTPQSLFMWPSAYMIKTCKKKKRFWQSRRDHNWCVLTVSSCTCLCLFIFSMLFCFISIRARRTDRRTDGRTRPLIEMRESGLMNLEPEMSRTRRTRRYFMWRKRRGVGGGHYVEKGAKAAIFHRVPAISDNEVVTS